MKEIGSKGVLMKDLWLRKNETQKLMETVESLTKSYGDFFSQFTKDVVGVDLLASGETGKTQKDKKKKAEAPDKNGKETSFLDLVTGFIIPANPFNRAMDGLFKNMKTTVFMNFFNYSIKMNSVFSEAKKNPFISDYQVNMMRNMYLDNTLDYIMDFLVKNRVDDFKLKDGSLNDEIIDIILNNVTKLAKTSYRVFPDIYNDVLTKIIPGDFIQSLLTYQDDRSEMEKVIDMLIHLSPQNFGDILMPLDQDPFLGALSMLNPRETKKEKTVVEALGDAIKKFDISGYSKVKAAGIIINRASDIYEEQKRMADTFLKTLVDSIPISEEKIPEEIARESEKEKTQAKKGAKAKKHVNSQSGTQEKNDHSTPIIETQNEQEESLIAFMAKKLLEGEWVNFEKIENQIYRFFE